MDLSPRGTLLTWFGALSICVGFLFLNQFALLAASICFVYIGLNAVRFKRFITAVSDRIEVKIVPSVVSLLVDNQADLAAIISNSHSSPVKVIGFRLKTPEQIHEESKEAKEQLLQNGSNLHLGLSLKSSSPGHFNVTRAVVTLQDSSKLFKHDLSVNCSAGIEIAPLSSKFENRIRLGSIAEATRLGTGSDLAMIREATVLTDFRSIDWKSTARTGKFIVKEFYPETDPAVLLIVDTSVLTWSSEVLVQLGELSITFLSSTAVGLILYDDRNVIDQLPASAGLHSRQLILRSLLAASTSLDAGLARKGTMLYQELIELIRLLQMTARNTPVGRVDVYAQSLLPYYESSISKYSLDLRKQGTFQALEIVSGLSPGLVIVISSLNRPLRGLCQGAMLANLSGHRIILATIGTARDTLPPELLALRESGIQVLQSGGADLANAICQAIVDIPMTRIRSPPRRLQDTRTALPT